MFACSGYGHGGVEPAGGRGVPSALTILTLSYSKAETLTSEKVSGTLPSIGFLSNTVSNVCGVDTKP